jgi:hypothetical protein
MSKTRIVSMAKITGVKYNLLPCMPYSPDLVPSDSVYFTIEDNFLVANLKI